MSCNSKHALAPGPIWGVNLRHCLGKYRWKKKISVGKTEGFAGRGRERRPAGYGARAAQRCIGNSQGNLTPLRRWNTAEMLESENRLAESSPAKAHEKITHTELPASQASQQARASARTPANMGGALDDADHAARRAGMWLDVSMQP